MRSYLVALIIFGSIPFIFKMPHVGIYVYSWISYMNPHRLTWGFAYDFPFAMIIGALTFLAWLISKEPKKLPITPLMGLMLFFTFWMTLSTVFAMSPEDAFWKWKQVIKIMGTTFLTVILIHNRARLDGLIWVIVGSIGFFALKGGVFAVLTGGAYRVWGPPSSLISENNSLALATIMIVPFLVYLGGTVKYRWLRLAILGSVPLMIFSVLASYSRGALLAIGAIGIFLWLKSRHKAAIGFGIVVMLAVSVNFMPQHWFDRMETLQSYEEDASAMGRLDAWSMGLNLALDRPILGGGFTVYDTSPKAWAMYAPGKTQRASHSIYFEVLAYHGFIGFFAFVAIGLLAYRNCSYVIRVARDRPDLQWASRLAAMTQVSLVGFATGGAFLNLAFFDLVWHIIAITVITRLIFDRQLAVEPSGGQSPAAMPEGETPAPAKSFFVPQKSFLRARRGTRQNSFIRKR